MARMRQVDGDIRLDAAGPRRHHDDARGHEDRLLDVVGDEQHRLLAPLPDAEQQFLHQPARLVVERAERLVQQQDLGIVGERAGDRGALLHAAGKLLWPMVLEPLEPDEVDIGCDDPAPAPSGHAAFAQAEGDVLAPPSATGTACRTGRPCRDPAPAASPPCRRAAPARRSAPPGRRRSAAASTFRSRTARGW